MPVLCLNVNGGMKVVRWATNPLRIYLATEALTQSSERHHALGDEMRTDAAMHPMVSKDD
jgi:hypothetical protein